MGLFEQETLTDQSRQFLIGVIRMRHATNFARRLSLLRFLKANRSSYHELPMEYRTSFRVELHGYWATYLNVDLATNRVDCVGDVLPSSDMAIVPYTWKVQKCSSRRASCSYEPSIKDNKSRTHEERQGFPLSLSIPHLQ